MNDATPSRWSLLEIDLTDQERASSVRRQQATESVAAKLERDRLRRENGPWIPGCGGTEEPFYTRTGHRLLYCWQPSTGRHAYLDCGSDVLIADDELSAYGLGA